MPFYFDPDQVADAAKSAFDDFTQTLGDPLASLKATQPPEPAPAPTPTPTPTPVPTATPTPTPGSDSLTDPLGSQHGLLDAWDPLAAYNLPTPDKYTPAPTATPQPSPAGDVLSSPEPTPGPAPTPAPEPAPTPVTLDRPSQFAVGLSTAEAYAACGPVAAMAFAQQFGRNPSAQEAIALAKNYGWTPERGMAGPQSEVQLLAAMDVPSHFEAGVDVAKVANAAAGGRPSIISTPGHYFTVDAFDPDTRTFHVGKSGTDLKAGSDWMSLDQMQAAMGKAQGTIYLDQTPDATTPKPSAAARTAPAATVTTAGMSGGTDTQQDSGQVARLMSIGKQAGDAFGGDAGNAIQAVLQTEGGLLGARGDNGQSYGPLQFLRDRGQLPAFAAYLGVDQNAAGQYAIDHPDVAIAWAVGTPDNPGYLGQAILRGQKQGLSGAQLATYIQATGQVSQSPERASANYNALFGPNGTGSATGTAGTTSGEAAGPLSVLPAIPGADISGFLQGSQQRTQDFLNQVGQSKDQVAQGAANAFDAFTQRLGDPLKALDFAGSNPPTDTTTRRPIQGGDLTEQGSPVQPIVPAGVPPVNQPNPWDLTPALQVDKSSPLGRAALGNEPIGTQDVGSQLQAGLQLVGGYEQAHQRAVDALNPAADVPVLGGLSSGVIGMATDPLTYAIQPGIGIGVKLAETAVGRTLAAAIGREAVDAIPQAAKWAADAGLTGGTWGTLQSAIQPGATPEDIAKGAAVGAAFGIGAGAVHAIGSGALRLPGGAGAASPVGEGSAASVPRTLTPQEQAEATALYRQVAKQTHPDAGGKPEDFMAAARAYQSGDLQGLRDQAASLGVSAPTPRQAASADAKTTWFDQLRQSVFDLAGSHTPDFSGARNVARNVGAWVFRNESANLADRSTALVLARDLDTAASAGDRSAVTAALQRLSTLGDRVATDPADSWIQSLSPEDTARLASQQGGAVIPPEGNVPSENAPDVYTKRNGKQYTSPGSETSPELLDAARALVQSGDESSAEGKAFAKLWDQHLKTVRGTGMTSVREPGDLLDDATSLVGTKQDLGNFDVNSVPAIDEVLDRPGAAEPTAEQTANFRGGWMVAMSGSPGSKSMSQFAQRGFEAAVANGAAPHSKPGPIEEFGASQWRAVQTAASRDKTSRVGVWTLAERPEGAKWWKVTTVTAPSAEGIYKKIRAMAVKEPRATTPQVTEPPAAATKTQGYAKVGRFANAKATITPDGTISVTGTLKPWEGWEGDLATKTLKLSDWLRGGSRINPGDIGHQRRLLEAAFAEQLNGPLDMRGGGGGWFHLLDAARSAINEAIAKRGAGSVSSESPAVQPADPSIDRDLTPEEQQKVEDHREYSRIVPLDTLREGVRIAEQRPNSTPFVRAMHHAAREVLAEREAKGEQAPKSSNQLARELGEHLEQRPAANAKPASPSERPFKEQSLPYMRGEADARAGRPARTGTRYSKSELQAYHEGYQSVARAKAASVEPSNGQPRSEHGRGAERGPDSEQGAQLPARARAGGQAAPGKRRRVRGVESTSNPAAGVEPDSQRPAAPRSVGRGAAAGSPDGLAPQRDYRLTPEDERWQERTPAQQRFEANIDAIRRVKDIQQTGRPVTEEDRAAFARFSGMGDSAFNDAFPLSKSAKPNARLVALGEELKQLLGEREYDSLTRSRINAFFTNPSIVKAMWETLQRIGADGLPGLRVLEPSAGSGRFIALMPPELHDRAQITAGEMDLVTGEMLKHLFPESSVHVGPFQRIDLEAPGAVPDDSQDIAISNVPFGNIRVADPAYRNQPDITGAVHNYFFAKALDKVRPGGIVAFITSHQTFDARSQGREDFRRYLAERADLLGAVRLPQGAFPDTAVTTDILFFRKRDVGGAKGMANPEWLRTEDRTFTDETGKEVTVAINQYFLEHPEMALGEHAVSRHSTAGGGKQSGYVLKGAKGDELTRQLRAALEKLPEGALRPAVSYTKSEATIAAEKSVEGSFVEHSDGTLRTLQDGQLRPAGRFVDRKTGREWVPYTPDQVARIRAMIGIHDFGRKVLDTQRSGAPEQEIKLAQAELKRAYDQFVKANGPLHSTSNKSLFSSDPRSYRLRAFEQWDEDLAKRYSGGNKPTSAEDLTALRTDIFSKNLQSGGQVKSAVTPRDALYVVLNERAALDFPRMAELLGRPDGEIASDLARQELMYRNPAAGGEWELADEYLSGKVKQKLAEARDAAREDPAYRANVEALEKVQPADIPAHEIDVRLGSPWVPEDDVNRFVRETMFRTSSQGENVKPVRLQSTSDSATWHLSNDARDMRYHLDYGKAQDWGTDRMGALEILENALNSRTIAIKDNVGTSSAPKYVLNEEETRAANGKARQLKAEFVRWLWSDADRAERLARFYNDTFNDTVLWDPNGSHLSLPGSNPNITLRPHQLAGVWRAIRQPTLLLAHEVGFGKSMTMAAAAMELKRLGLSKRTTIVVPNHLVGQMASEFYKLYPQANLLVPDKSDYQAANRATLMARIATGDWDAVIVPQSQFKLLPVHPQTAVRFAREMVDEINAVIKAYIASKNGKVDKDDPTLKELKKKAENAIADLQDRTDKLTAYQNEAKHSLTWDELGVDALMVDEADQYKNLQFFTTRTRIKGLPNSKSDRAFDMFMKTRMLLEQHGRGLVFATGTPISNTIAELWTMLRYLAPKTLQDLQMTAFDAWANTFGETVEAIEQTVTGKRVPVERFARFGNAPELSRLFQTVADIRMAEDSPEMEAKKPRMKNGRRIAVELEPTEWHAEYVKRLEKRAEDLKHRRGKPQKGDDNMLAITGDAKKASLDPQLVGGPDLGDQGKIGKTAAIVADVLERTADNKGAVGVFLDMGTPRSTAGVSLKDLPKEVQEAVKAAKAALGAEWDSTQQENFIAAYYATHELGDAAEQVAQRDVYNRLKAKIVARGVPAEQIAFIHDAKTDAQKQELFRQVNAGEKRVIIGSTEKMGAGSNFQERLAALIHMDTPWRPRDLEQREGRILRPGNKVYGPPTDNRGNPLKDERGQWIPGPGVEIYQLVTKWPFDEYLWSLLLSKLRAIKSFMRRDVTARTVSDVDEVVLSYEEMKAIASGDPLTVKLLGVEEELRQLEAELRSFQIRQARAEGQVKRLPDDIRGYQGDLDQVLADQKLRDSAPKDFSITVDGKRFSKRPDAGQPLLDALQRAMKTSDWTAIGTIKGFSIEGRAVQDNVGQLRLRSPGAATRAIAYTSNGINALDLVASGMVVRVEGLLRQIDQRAEMERFHVRENTEALAGLQRSLKQPFASQSRLEQLRTARDLIVRKQGGEEGITDEQIDEALHGAPALPTAAAEVEQTYPPAEDLAAQEETESAGLNPNPASEEPLASAELPAQDNNTAEQPEAEIEPQALETPPAPAQNAPAGRKPAQRATATRSPLPGLDYIAPLEDRGVATAHDRAQAMEDMETEVGQAKALLMKPQYHDDRFPPMEAKAYRATGILARFTAPKSRTTYEVRIEPRQMNPNWAIVVREADQPGAKWEAQSDNNHSLGHAVAELAHMLAHMRDVEFHWQPLQAIYEARLRLRKMQEQGIPILGFGTPPLNNPLGPLLFRGGHEAAMNALPERTSNVPPVPEYTVEGSSHDERQEYRRGWTDAWLGNPAKGSEWTREQATYWATKVDFERYHGEPDLVPAYRQHEAYLQGYREGSAASGNAATYEPNSELNPAIEDEQDQAEIEATQAAIEAQPLNTTRPRKGVRANKRQELPAEDAEGRQEEELLTPVKTPAVQGPENVPAAEPEPNAKTPSQFDARQDLREQLAAAIARDDFQAVTDLSMQLERLTRGQTNGTAEIAPQGPTAAPPAPPTKPPAPPAGPTPPSGGEENNGRQHVVGFGYFAGADEAAVQTAATANGPRRIGRDEVARMADLLDLPQLRQWQDIITGGEEGNLAAADQAIRQRALAAIDAGLDFERRLQDARAKQDRHETLSDTEKLLLADATIDAVRAAVGADIRAGRRFSSEIARALQQMKLEVSAPIARAQYERLEDLARRLDAAERVLTNGHVPTPADLADVQHAAEALEAAAPLLEQGTVDQTLERLQPTTPSAEDLAEALDVTAPTAELVANIPPAEQLARRLVALTPQWRAARRAGDWDKVAQIERQRAALIGEMERILGEDLKVPEPLSDEQQIPDYLRDVEGRAAKGVVNKARAELRRKLAHPETEREAELKAINESVRKLVLEQEISARDLLPRSARLAEINEQQAQARTAGEWSRVARLESERDKVLRDIRTELERQALARIEAGGRKFPNREAAQRAVDEELGRGALGAISRRINEAIAYPNRPIDERMARLNRRALRTADRQEINDLAAKLRNFANVEHRPGATAQTLQGMTETLQQLQSISQAAAQRGSRVRESLFRRGLKSYLGKTLPEDRLNDLTTLMMTADPHDPRSVGQIVRGLRKPTIWDYLKEYTVVNLLTSPLTWGPTGINTISNTAMIAGHVLVSMPLDALHDRLRYASNRHIFAREIPELLRGIASPSGFERSWRLAWENWLKGNTADQYQVAAETGDLRTVRREYLSELGGPFGTIFEWMHRFSTRPLESGDIFQGNMLYAGMTQSLAYRKARRLVAARDPYAFDTGGRGGVFEPSGEGGIEQGPGRALSVEEVRDKILRNIWDHTDVMAEAGKVEQYTLFRQRPSQVVQRLGALRNAGPAASGFRQFGAFLAQQLMPFVYVPFNTTAQQLSTSVPGAIYNGARYFSENDPYEQARRFRLAMIGAGLLGLAIALYAGDNITGDGPTDPSKKRLWQQDHQRDSLRVAGKWLSYDGLPFALQLSMVVNTLDAFQEAVDKTEGKLSSGDALNVLTSGVGGGVLGAAQTVLNQPFLQQASDWLGVLSGDHNPSFLVSGLASRWVPMDAMLAFLARAGDGVVRDVSSTTERIGNRIPFVRNALRPQLNPFGEEVPNEQSGLAAILPFRPATLSNDPTLKEFERLGVGIPTAPRSIQNVELTDDEQYAYNKLVGPALKQVTQKAMASAAWGRLNDQQKARVLRQLVQQVRDQVGPRVLLQIGKDEVRRRVLLKARAA